MTQLRALEREPENIIQHDDEAEQAVIGSVLKNPLTFVRIADQLNAGDFYVQKHRAIYAAMQDLWSEGTAIDHYTLVDRGEGFTMLDLSAIDLEVPSSAHIVHYADIVKRHSRLRDVARLCYQGFLQTMREAADPSEVVQHVMQSFQGLDAGGTKLIGGEEFAHQIMEAVAAPRTGERLLVPTGLLNTNQLYGGGLAAGTLNLLMGVTGMGKTELALQIAFWVGEHVGTTLYVSLEMEEIELGQRIARVEGGLDRNALATGVLTDQQSESALAVCQRIAGSKFWVTSPVDRYTTDVLRAQALRLRMQSPDGIKLIVVDYVQRLDDVAGKNSNREQDVALMAKNLKSIARELHCPVLALVQPNRDYAGRPNKRPRLSDLRESGRLEIEADTVVGLHRDEFFFENCGRDHQADLFMLKNRSGIGAGVGESETLIWVSQAPGAGRYGDYALAPGEPRQTARLARQRGVPRAGHSDPPPAELPWDDR